MLPEPLGNLAVLIIELFREVLAEGGEVALDVGQFFPPFVVIDGQQLVEVRSRDADAVQRKAFRLRHVTDGCFDTLAAALDPLRDPDQDAHIITEPRPEEASVFALAEPVDEKIFGGFVIFCPIVNQWSKYRPILYPQNGSMAIGSRRIWPTLPSAAAVCSDAMVAPTKTPWFQS